jgi:hypothetical protein
MSFIKKEMMFEHVECKIDDENPKRKKGEKNVLTHAFFFFSSFESHPNSPTLSKRHHRSKTLPRRPKKCLSHRPYTLWLLFSSSVSTIIEC